MLLHLVLSLNQLSKYKLQYGLAMYEEVVSSVNKQFFQSG